MLTTLPCTIVITYNCKKQLYAFSTADTVVWKCIRHVNKIASAIYKGLSWRTLRTVG